MINTIVEIEHSKDFEEQGFYSRTYLAEDKRLKRKVAVKDILLDHLTSREDFEKYFEEAFKLSVASHPRVLPVYYVGLDHSPTDGKPIPRIVTCYLKNGSLNAYIKSVYDTGRTLCLDEIIRFAHDIIQGMIHLHSLDILHLDLKASNIYIGDDKKMIIGDFGQSRFIKDGIVFEPGNLYPAIAPQEAITKKAIDKTADIYQFGLLLYSMVCYDQYRKALEETYKIDTNTLIEIFRENRPDKAAKKKEFQANMKLFTEAIKTCKFPSRTEYPYYVHSKIKEIIHKCLEPNVANRYNNFYDIQSDLNEIIFPDQVSDFYQDLATGKVHFIKEAAHCEIEVSLTNDKFELKAKKDKRRCHKNDKSDISVTKLSKNLFTLASEI
ncbi:serine/threonine protein kinase [Chitinophaga sp. W2I13]|uniref:protein kinase domain-containing protein n=1 Tax=Chitinophaga sp. W2I13 TaxID=3373923 RepID=UPI003D1D49E6